MAALRGSVSTEVAALFFAWPDGTFVTSVEANPNWIFAIDALLILVFVSTVISMKQSIGRFVV